MDFFEEQLLEPVARYFRFNQSLDFLPKNKKLSIVDLGCGPKFRFYFFAKNHGVKMARYLGIDPLAKSKIKEVEVIKSPLGNSITVKSNSCDIVTGFAFLEHIKNPGRMLSESIRVLKPGGVAIFTTPTPPAKALLEFLSFKLNLISPREIKEHKNYFTKESLALLLKKNKSRIKIVHRYFEFGLNNLLIIKKSR